MAESPFIGAVFLFGGSFAPLGYAMCQGQLLPIAQNAALFSILGTTYGGNGTTTFGLPDLRGRVPLGMGVGPGLSPYVEGELGGSENVTLLQTQIPAHNHLLNYANTQSTNRPQNALLAPNGAYSTQPVAGSMSNTAVSVVGGSQPHTNLQPFLALNFIIALQGVFPSRS